MTVQPLHDRVLVKRAVEEEKLASGIIVPPAAQEKPLRGTVIAVGSGKVLPNGTVRPLDVKVGDEVLFTKYGGTEVKIESEHIILREDDILGVIVQ